MRTKLLVVAVTMALSAGCASTPTNSNPYANEIRQVASTTAVAPASASMYIAPAVAIQSTPTWFLKPPATTASEIFVAGTGLSKDLSMSKQKALMDAQTKLADRLAGEISVLTKDYKAEQGENFVQNTEIMARKIAADVRLAGYTVVDGTLWSEGGGYRTYILVKYPLSAQQQRMVQHNVRSSQAAAERDLNAGVAESRQRKNETVTMQRKPNSPLGLNDSKEED